MMSLAASRPDYSTVCRASLKLAAAAYLWLLAATPGNVAAQSAPAGAGAELRAELTALISAGQPEDAVRRVQAALRAAPADKVVRREYSDLHMFLARAWLAERRFADCSAALEAIRSVDPRHAEAARLLEELRAARQRAGQQVEQIDRLLELELFESALDRIDQTAALRPDLADELRERRRAARLGVADDHYLARNFSEAFALYESLLADHANLPASLHSRWAVSLALALAEDDFTRPPDPNAAGRLLARAIDVLGRTSEPIVGQIIDGLLAERAGRLADAGRAYSAALGAAWSLPPADRRRTTVRELRRQAVRRARAIYRDTPVRRRGGFWAIALPDVWKHRQAENFDVHARNDLVAERVAATAEFHLAGLRQWLGLASGRRWQPRCELRVHATLADLQQATGTKGITFAVSHTRRQGDQVLLRRLDVFQADPWLLGSTLPHELTHLLIAAEGGDPELPLAVEEGLALQAEPPARRLMYRRLLDAKPPDLSALLAIEQLPTDVEGFYAEAGALTAWLLDRLAAQPGPDLGSPPIARLLDLFADGLPTGWSGRLGLDSAAAAEKSWSGWHAGRRAPYRMPLMILVEPSPEHRQPPD